MKKLWACEGCGIIYYKEKPPKFCTASLGEEYEMHEDLPTENVTFTNKRTYCLSDKFEIVKC